SIRFASISPHGAATQCRKRVYNGDMVPKVSPVFIGLLTIGVASMSAWSQPTGGTPSTQPAATQPPAGDEPAPTFAQLQAATRKSWQLELSALPGLGTY